MIWTPRTVVGAVILLVVAVAAIVWLSLDPTRIQAWALLTQVVQVAGSMVQGG